MSDEFDPTTDSHFSSFWPLLILISGFLIWFGLQDYGLNSQRSAYNKQFQDKQFQDAIVQSQNITKKYRDLMSDLLQTAQKEGKDSVAAKIVNDAIQAGLIRVQPNATNSATAAGTETSTDASKQ